jgi:hypothetical protein
MSLAILSASVDHVNRQGPAGNGGCCAFLFDLGDGYVADLGCGGNVGSATRLQINRAIFANGNQPDLPLPRGGCTDIVRTSPGWHPVLHR